MSDTGDIRALARPLKDAGDLDPLLERVGDARVVLLGEASHGTHEYYAWRTELTRRLVTEKGFRFVAVEGDWPDCHEVHRCITLQVDAEPEAVLHDFARWPTWMWANREVVELAQWLREHNAGQPADRRVGFHGLDVYSLWDSLRAVLDYLREHEPEHLPEAQRAFACFSPYGEDPQEYALATRFVPDSCEQAVVTLLQRLCQERPVTDGDRDARFVAEQNAAVAAGAERYYRAMVRGGAASWNVRDEHMTDTLDRLCAHYGDDAKAVVWEHNTHVGDARATDMARQGEVNVGQLVRERRGAEQVVILGFGSHRGSVVAADAWGDPLEVMPVPPARPGSVEALLHDALDGGDALVVVPPPGERPRWLTEERGHRAIGVVYRPEYERWGNYVPTVLGERYDAFAFLDETRALSPLHAEAPQHDQEQETYPAGM